jgi:hypothetical protein
MVSGTTVPRSRTIAGSLIGAGLLLFSAIAASADKTPRQAPSGRPDLSAPLAGATYDYAWDGVAIGHPERAWLGRAYVPPQVGRDASKPVPVLVFLHGLNRELIPYRWMGGGKEGDVRRIVQALIDRKLIEPTLVVAPSSIVKSAVAAAETSWPSFDLDAFLAETRVALKGHATMDETRIIVAGHSGAGCNDKGGLAAIATSAKTTLLALLSVDTCMGLGLAQRLGQVDDKTAIVVTYQAQTWRNRPFSDFKRRLHAARVSTAETGSTPILREIEAMQPREPFPHDALVRMTLEKWLPRWFSSTKSP